MGSLIFMLLLRIFQLGLPIYLFCTGYSSLAWSLLAVSVFFFIFCHVVDAIQILFVNLMMKIITLGKAKDPDYDVSSLCARFWVAVYAAYYAYNHTPLGLQTVSTIYVALAIFFAR